jgi:SAM-dependent methyltransferase
MCNIAIIEFFVEEIEAEEFRGRKVLEIGSNPQSRCGSVRPLIEKFVSPREYVGVDIEPGRYVDVVARAEELTDYFDENSVDVVIATELIEHVRDWRIVVNNMKRVLKPGAYIYITTRSIGYPFHACPYDCWRYQAQDIRKIFSDFEVISLKQDPIAPGVFLKARKPIDWKPADLEEIYLYSIILGRRTKAIPRISDMPLIRRLKQLTVVRLASFLPLFRKMFTNQ